MKTRMPALVCAAWLLLGSPAAGEEPGGETSPEASQEAPPRQYEIRIVQGASRADVERLTSGSATSLQSSRSTRSGPQTTSLRVTSGKPASIETGRIVQAVDAVFVSRYGFGTGVEYAERPVTRGFTVTAKPRGGRVEVEIEAAIAREGRGQPADRQIQMVRTNLLVPEGRWVEVGGGAESPDPGAKTYGTHAPLEESGLLIRVDRLVR